MFTVDYKLNIYGTNIDLILHKFEITYFVQLVFRLVTSSRRSVPYIFFDSVDIN